MKEKKLLIFGVLCILAVCTSNLWGNNPRTSPIDVYIVVDSSSAMERGREQAISWLSTTVIDNMLLNTDRIWIWTAGARPELIYSGNLANKEEVKALIRSISFEGDAADYRGALFEAQSLAQRSDRTTYTLLISGSGAKDPPTREAESAGLLRYSRVESFPGWRVLTVGLDLTPNVRRSAAYYSNNARR